MDFSFTEEQEMWRTMMQDFTEKEAGREYTRMCDQEKHYPQELWEAGNKEGFLGLLIPKEFGGICLPALKTSEGHEGGARGKRSPRSH